MASFPWPQENRKVTGKGEKRSASRISAEAVIACRPFCGGVEETGGLMRNFSSSGAYIESSSAYLPGTVLMLRMLHYPPLPAEVEDDQRPRCLCMAEVKWRQELSDGRNIRYGLGLRYLQ